MDIYENKKLPSKPSKTSHFPQEPMAWKAFTESIKRTESDPTPINRSF